LLALVCSPISSSDASFSVQEEGAPLFGGKPMDTFSQEHHQPGREKRKQDFLDVELSLFVALIIDAQPNTCFDNVLDMFLKYLPDEISSCGGKLIEGWYVVDLEDEVVVNEHGWCSLPDGRIIDPTVVRLVPPAYPVYYFPGVERSWQEVQDIVQQKDAYFPYVRSVGIYGKDGLGNQAYKAAHDAARQKVYDLANATQPPKRMTFLTAQDLGDDQRDGGIRVQIMIISPEQDEEEKD
jgi:hypothetical protein